MTVEEILAVSTAVPPQERESDVWDGENCVNYSADGRLLLEAENFPSEITVREGCEIICDEAFAFQDYMAERRIGEEIPLEERNSYLEKIHLPATVTHIGKGAFAECGELTSVKLPAGLLSIGPSAFLDCWQLEKITLPAQTRIIGPGAFQGCINLCRIKLGKAVEIIGDEAIDDCESLEAIVIPKGMKAHFKELLPRKLHKLLEE